MTIRVKQYVEPLSLASHSSPAITIESDAYRQVVTDLEMYVDGYILGRSFLVAGHRGVGKTTMLRQAVQDVAGRMQARGTKAGKWARPLFIALHGPDLLTQPPPEAAASDGKTTVAAEGAADPTAANSKATDATAKDTTAGSQAGAAPPKPPPLAELYHFLDRITSGLYLGAAQEVARCFRERVEKSNASPREKADLMELAADLQVQLDRQPDLDRLRHYWSRVNALDGGVLFEKATDAGRGAAEVTALFSIGRAMRTFAGKTEAEEQSENTRTREGSVSLVTVDGQSLLTPLIGLATGALVWSAIPEAQGALVKAVTALTTGVGAVLALKVTALRSRKSTQTWKEKFIPSNDPGSLYRVLPGLIERFQRVGLYPVFVVDELDKVPRLGGKINALLGYMKQFVTERAFFCFVTNRSFYQQAQAQSETTAYSTLHTRFGDSVFVRYRPEDFHRYLERIISVESEPSVDPVKAQDAAIVLRYILLGRCYLHPYDLRRNLSQLQSQSQDPEGMLNWSVDELLGSPMLLREVAMQVAVEVAFNAPALREHLRDPVAAQTMLDALYYPARAWRAGTDPLVLDEAKLIDHLVGRTGIAEELEASEAPMAASQLVPLPLQRAVVEQVDALMKAFTDPPSLKTAALQCGLELPMAIEARLSGVEPIVEPIVGVLPGPRYRFRFDAKGRELTPAPEAQAPASTEQLGRAAVAEGVPPTSDTAIAAAAIEDTRRRPAQAPEFLIELADWLDEHWTYAPMMELLETKQVLQTPPNWSYASTAARQMLGKEISKPELAIEYPQVVRQYATMLRNRQPVMDKALALAAYAARASRSSDPQEQLSDALKALPDGAQLEPPADDFPFPVLLPPHLREGRAREWAEAVKQRHEAAMARPFTDDWAVLEGVSWELWRGRLNEYERGSRRKVDSILSDVLMQVRQAGGAQLFRVDLGNMSVREWTNAYRIALRDRANLAWTIPDWTLSPISYVLGLNQSVMLIIVAESAAAPSARWIPSKSHGCLWIARADVADAAQEMAGRTVFASSTPVIAVEVTLDDLGDSAELPPVEEISEPLKLLLPGGARLAYFGRQKLPSVASTAYPYIDNPRNVDDLIRKYEQLAQRP